MYPGKLFCMAMRVILFVGIAHYGDVVAVVAYNFPSGPGGPPPPLQPGVIPPPMPGPENFEQPGQRPPPTPFPSFGPPRQLGAPARGFPPPPRAGFPSIRPPEGPARENFPPRQGFAPRPWQQPRQPMAEPMQRFPPPGFQQPRPIELPAKEVEKEDIRGADFKGSTSLLQNKKLEQEDGLDTVKVAEPEGNWLKKRAEYEKAQALYGQLKAVVDAVFDERMKIFEQHATFEHNEYEGFARTTGFGLGELNTALGFIIDKVKAAKNGNDDDNEVLQDILGEEKTLEDLQTAVTTVTKYHEDLQSALALLEQQLNRCRQYDRQAWEKFKEIAQVLSDQKAKELCYEIDALLKSAQDIHGYLEQEFSQHFNQLISEAHNRMETVKNEVAAFKAKNIDLMQKVIQLEKSKQEEQEKETEEQDAEQEESEGVWGTIKGWFSTFADSISNFFDWIKSFFGGSQSESQD